MSTVLDPVVHIAGPMIGGVQHCLACRAVLADESRITEPSHVPGSSRYTRGFRVLIVPVDPDTRIQGPYPEKAPLPPKTRLCTSLPTSEKSTP